FLMSVIGMLQVECIVLAVKHGGWSVMIWGPMSAKGVVETLFIDCMTNVGGYDKLLADMIIPSLQMPGRRTILHHGNDPKHTAKNQKECQKKKEVKNLVKSVA
uniref:Tc1-like transposase DDE domain-containing protein n=1 Tax=Amphiprion percula TaxID=161767 RepID=A0A3P8RZJ7_AMPPE